MKKIKWITSLFIVGQLMLWQVSLLQAQTVQEQVAIPLSNPGKPGTLKVSMMQGDLLVKGYDGKEVVLRVEMPEMKNSISQAKNGLRKISTNGMGLEVREQNNVVYIESMSHNGEGNMEVLVPRNFSLNLHTVNGEMVEVQGVNGEIVVDNVNGGILLKDVQGAAVLNTVNGDIGVSFDKVSSNAPMAFTNLNGKVEVALPASAAFSVKAKTEHGEVYTDFDMKLRQDKERVKTSNSKGVYRVNIENWVQGDVNGGGPEYLFKSLNGDILIRKK